MARFTSDQLTTSSIINGQDWGKLWEFDTGYDYGVHSSPAIGLDGTVYVGSHDSSLYAINGKTGAKLWEFGTANIVFSSPAIGSDGTVYVGSQDRKIYAINGKTGVKLWEFETGVFPVKPSIPLSPAIGSDGTVYVGSLDKKLYALNGQDWGQAMGVWNGSSVHNPSPAIGSDGTGVGSGDNKLYALKSNSLGLAEIPLAEVWRWRARIPAESVTP